MISSQGVHDTFIYNIDNFFVLIVIWSIDIWDDVHILVKALNWLSVEPPTGRVAVPSFIYPPFPLKFETAALPAAKPNVFDAK